MVLSVEEALNWQVPLLVLCQLHPTDLQSSGLYSASCHDVGGLTQWSCLCLPPVFCIWEQNANGESCICTYLNFWTKLRHICLLYPHLWKQERARITGLFIWCISDWVGCSRDLVPFQCHWHYRQISLAPALPSFPYWLNLPLLLGFQKMPRMDCLSKQQMLSVCEVQDCPTQ